MLPGYKETDRIEYFSKNADAGEYIGVVRAIHSTGDFAVWSFYCTRNGSRLTEHLHSGAYNTTASKSWAVFAKRVQQLEDMQYERHVTYLRYAQ